MNADHSAFPAPTLTPPPRVLLVAAPFYRSIADDMIAGARAALESVGAAHELIEVPGALEIAPAIAHAAAGGGFEGYVALGCIIRGETTHYELVCNESARGITELTVRGRLAVGNGVLTVENEAQALARCRSAADGGQDKGGGAAIACLSLIELARRFGPSRTPTFAPDSDPVQIA